MLDEVIGTWDNGKIYDLHNEKNQQGKAIKKNSIMGEEILRHSFAHVLAQALQNLYEKVFFAIGPITENGFFYDFQVFQKEVLINLSSKDLPKIEKEMRKIIKNKYDFKKTIISKKEFLKNTNDTLKKQVLNNIQDQEISIYTQGSFQDLCKGPHVLNTSQLGQNFKLTNVSQVQWRDNLVQRIEGVAFASEDSLKQFLQNRAQQEARDHKVLGKEMGLFSLLKESPGFINWKPKGLYVINKLKELLRKTGFKAFREYETALMVKNDVFRKTGHIQNYSENMFLFPEHDCSLKPMNCPLHGMLFNEENLSYKNLPYRIGEFGSCFRNENSGGLNGLKRARKFTIDDGHIFLEEKDLKTEIECFLNSAEEFYKKCGFESMEIFLATQPEKSLDNKEKWQKAENILKEAIGSRHYRIAEGDGAFYGPKIELQLKDNMNRFWQCGTIQVDFFLGENLDLNYQCQDNSRSHPIVLHRAVAGSLERFLAILLENGPLPLWIQPTQVSVISVDQDHHSYAKEIQQQLIKSNIQTDINLLQESVSKKIKKSLKEKISYVVILGDEEIKTQTISYRHKNQTHNLTLEEFILLIKSQC